MIALFRYSHKPQLIIFVFGFEEFLPFSQAYSFFSQLTTPIKLPEIAKSIFTDVNLSR